MSLRVKSAESTQKLSNDPMEKGNKTWQFKLLIQDSKARS